MSEFNFVDLFCGAGGLSCGLEMSGMRCVLGTDQDKAAIDTFQKNHPDAQIFVDDISKLTKAKLKKATGGKKIHLVCGGPPCQGFSIFGKRRFVKTRNYNPLEDDRNDLVKIFFDFIIFFFNTWANNGYNVFIIRV